MKKKIIFLVLVFGLASAANAALTFTVGGSAPGAITLDPVANPTITLEITGDGQTPHPVNAYVTVEGQGSVNGATMNYVGSLSDYWDLPAMADNLGMTEQGVLDFYRDASGRAGITDIAFAMLNDGAGVPAAIDGLLVSDIIFTCEGQPDEVVLSLLDYLDYSVYDSVTITQVPEPMTMVLLGLGGLFLRRRK